MNTGVPRPAWILGLAGTLPFIFGALLLLMPELVTKLTDAPIFTARLLGNAVLHTYGVVIFAFMAGVLWGFATRATPADAGRYYFLSVIPAILIFFAALYGAVAPLIGMGQASLAPLILAFIALLGLDYVFAKSALAPPWWMKLRLTITTIVLVCLVTGLFAG